MFLPSLSTALTPYCSLTTSLSVRKCVYAWIFLDPHTAFQPYIECKVGVKMNHISCRTLLQPKMRYMWTPLALAVNVSCNSSKIPILK